MSHRSRRKEHEKCNKDKKSDKDRDDKWRKECDQEETQSQKVHHQCVNKQRVKQSTVHNSTVQNSTVQNLTVSGSGGSGGTLDVDRINTRELFINNKEFPTSIIPFKISESMVIVGPNGACGDEACPAATPGTPQGGLFALGRSFTGKITFCGVTGINLNLVGLVLSNVDDYAIEIINCNQVYIHGGSVNSLNSPAIRVTCSTDVEFTHINTTNSGAALEIDNSLDLKIRHWYIQNVSQFAIRVQDSRYLRVTGIDINGGDDSSDLTTFSDRALIDISRSDMIFVNNCAFYNMNVQEAVGEKGVIYMDTCFDVKVSHISILTTIFTAPVDTNLNVFLTHFINSGSMILGSFIIDGDSAVVSGTGEGQLICLRIEECNNVFMAHHLMTDNFVSGEAGSATLSVVGVRLINVETFTMNGSKICTNYVEGGGVNTEVVVYSFFGSELEGAGLKSGNWFLSGNICNQNYVTSDTRSLVGGYFVLNASSTVLFQRCSANNHGNLIGTARQVEAFRVVDPNNNAITNIKFDHCAANQNNSNDTFGQTTGFYSTYSNTNFNACEAIANTAGLDCNGFQLTGIVGRKQLNVSLYHCTGNSNTSSQGRAHGVFAGPISIQGQSTAGVETLVVQYSTFTDNLGSSVSLPGFGISLQQVEVSSIIGNLLNENNCALCIVEGFGNNVYGNSALNNDRGFAVNNSPDSVFEKNLAQLNTVGYVDNTTGGNTYYTNKAVSNTTQFNTIGFVIPVFRYNKPSGTFTYVSGEPTLNAFTNLSS